MRSLAGLAALVAAATAFLYLLSTHLPPGPTRVLSDPAGQEGQEGHGGQEVQEYRYGN